MTATERQSDKDDMRNMQQAIGGNREAMRLFEKCINTNDLELGRRLIAETAAFKTPVSPTPLYGAEGYLSVVGLMRRRFPDVQWKLVDMVADENTDAAFLDSQGDEWGAQKDMLCDMSGAVCSVSSFLSFNSNEDARRSCNV